ncbi:MAG: hypothetical protein M3O70_06170 [Actinomycetota bacterium]|nr:hypothetical protein [Actinomycetota bacterium]
MGDPGTISVEASARRYADKVELTLWLHIPDGAHVEAHEPPDPALIPTVVEFTDLEARSVSYPEPVEKDLGLPGPPLLVYEGSISVTAEGRADETLQIARGTIRYQPCVGGACLPPREQTWQVPIEPAAPSGY